MTDAPSALGGHRFHYPIDVRFRDLDAMGHVNNAVILNYLESARIAYWLEVTRRSGLAALDMILARTEIDYRAPIGFGAKLAAGVRCLSIKRSSFVMGFVLVETRAGQLLAEARKVLVYYDYTAGRARPIPEEIRAQLKAQDPDLVDEA